MANFRTERLFIRVNGSIDGFDPNEGIDVVTFANIMIDDQDSYGRPSLADFTFAPFDRPKWFPAAKGLQAVRELAAKVETKFQGCDDDLQLERLQNELQTLRAVEDRLDIVDTHDLKFCFLARDLA